MALIFWLSVAFIVYTYAGYPLLLWLLARLRGRRSGCPPNEPRVTLIIAALNEQDVIARKLENSLGLDYPRERLQVVVAADGSIDRTPEIARRYAGQGVEVSFQPARQGKIAAINNAMTKAKGEVVVFSDANNMYTPETLRELVGPFCDPQVGAVSGAKSIVSQGDDLSESEGLYWKYESFIKEQETRLGSCTGVAGEILAVRKDLYTPPPDRIINDDFYIAMAVLRQGCRVVYNRRARSYEAVSQTAQDEMTRRSRIIAGRFQAMGSAAHILPWRSPLLVWQVVSHKFFRPLVPVAMLTALLANLAAVIRPPEAAAQWSDWLRLAFPYNWILLALQGSFYGLAWLGNRFSLPGKAGKLLSLPAFLYNSNLAALTGLFRYANGRESVLWQRVARRQEVIDE